MSAVAKDRQATITAIDEQRLADIIRLGPQEDEEPEDYERRKMLAATTEASDEAKDALSDYSKFPRILYPAMHIKMSFRI